MLIEQNDLTKAEIYLGEGHRQMRATLRGALRDLDLDVTDDFEECTGLLLALRNGHADLLIIDADLPGGDTGKIVHDIRHGNLGGNPFIPLIVTTWKNDPARIRSLIDCGVDGLLAKPISISAIRMQVDTIINRRKPFVVTSSYIGPDRRKDPTHTSDAPLIEVPNTLQRKVNGNPVDLRQLKREISGVQESVKSERLRRNAFELAFLVELIMEEDRDDGSPDQLGRFARRLLAVVLDTIDRIVDSAFAPSAVICKSLRRVAETIVVDHPNHGSQDIALLKPLSDAILLAFNPERTAEALADDITQAITQFKGRQSAKKGRSE